MANRKSALDPSTRRSYARAGLEQANAINRLLRVLKHKEVDEASSRSLQLLLSLDSRKAKELEAIWSACEFIIERRLVSLYPQVMSAMSACSELAVRGFEFVTETSVNPTFASLHLEAKLAILSALRSDTVWVANWTTWYYLLVNASEEAVSQAALEIAPDVESFLALQDSQRLAWLSRRNLSQSVAKTEGEDAILTAVLARQQQEHDSERGMAMLARARSEYTKSALSESSFEAMLLGYLHKPGTSHTLRSHAIVALGLRGVRSQAVLSHLYPIYRENPFNLGGISAQAIARIAAAAKRLPHQLDFCWNGGSDGRLAVLGTLLDSTLPRVPAYAAEAIVSHPHGLSELTRRLMYLAENCNDTHAALFSQAAAATSNSEEK